MRWIGVLAFLLPVASALLGPDLGSRSGQESFAVPSQDVHPTRVPAQGHQAAHVNAAITPQTPILAQNLCKNATAPGCSLGVVSINGSEVTTMFNTSGIMAEDGTPVQPETLFGIGSCSKAFLASAMGILMDDFEHDRNVTALPPTLSAFTWDTKIQELLPGDWKLDDEWSTEKANVRDVLSHVTGMTAHNLAWLEDDSPLSLIRRMRFLKTKFELREQWSYNNLMYALGAQIVSTYSGVPFRDFVKQRIFEPLNMTATTYRWDEAEASGLFSQAWDRNGRRIPYWFSSESTSEFIAGAGGIISNPVDMLKWVAMLLNQGVDPSTNRTVIPRSVLDEITTAHSIVEGVPLYPQLSIVGYGMGWIRFSVSGHNIVTHAGGVPGFSSIVVLLPDSNTGVVAFVNGEAEDSPEIVTSRILEDILDLEGPVHLGHTSVENAFGSRPANSVRACRSEDSPSISTPLEHFEGIYTDAGYGTLVFCTSTSQHPSCAQTLLDWSSITPDGILDPNTLYGSTKRVSATHLSMHRTGDGSFVLRLGTIFPTGYGKDTSPFIYNLLPAQDKGVPYAECEVNDDGSVDGCGIMNLEDGGPIPGNTVQERADVWFQRSPLPSQ